MVDKEPVRGPSKKPLMSGCRASYVRGSSPSSSSHHPGLSVLGVSLGDKVKGNWLGNGEEENDARSPRVSVGNIGDGFGSALLLSARYKIHYPGWVSRWDEWVVRERLRWSWQTTNDNSFIRANDPVEIWCSGNNVPGAWLEARVRRVRPQKLPPGFGRESSVGGAVGGRQAQRSDQQAGGPVEVPLMVVGSDGSSRPFIRSSDGREYDVGKVLSNGRNEWEPRERIRLVSRRSDTGEVARSLGRASKVASSLFFSTHIATGARRGFNGSSGSSGVFGHRIAGFRLAYPSVASVASHDSLVGSGSAGNLATPGQFTVAAGRRSGRRRSDDSSDDSSDGERRGEIYGGVTPALPSTLSGFGADGEASSRAPRRHSSGGSPCAIS